MPNKFPLSKITWCGLLTMAVATNIMMAGLEYGEYADPSRTDLERPPSAVVAEKLFSLVKLDGQDMREVRTALEAGLHEKALEAWRNQIVLRLRDTRFTHGRQPWKYLQEESLETADFLVGRNPDFFKSDVWGVAGPPPLANRVNWVAREKEPSVGFWDKGKIYDFLPGRIESLVGAWFSSEDPIYLHKYFELLEDFSVYRPEQVKALPPELRSHFAPRYSMDAADTLKLADTTITRLRMLALAVKILPGAQPSWQHKHSGKNLSAENERKTVLHLRFMEEVLLPVDTPVSQNSLELVPPTALANLVISLLMHDCPVLMRRYQHYGAVPNQRLTGLIALNMVNALFRPVEPFGENAQMGLLDYLNASYLPDGGDIEPSFNYNSGLVDGLRQVLWVYGEKDHPLLAKIRAACLAREELLAAVTFPGGGLPRIGSGGHALPRRDGEGRQIDYEEVRELEEMLTKTLSPIARAVYQNHLVNPVDVPFTSIAYPYSGYIVQRKDWTADSPYAFMISSRNNRGHDKPNRNSLELAAYGREFLVAAGPPPYNDKFLPEDQRPQFATIVDYVKGPFASNTVIVDGLRQQLPAYSEGAPEPISWRQFKSQWLDVNEGFFKAGYAEGKDTVIDGSHQRRLLFLRDWDLWIVEDTLQVAGEHRYTQIWKFPPAEGEVKGTPVQLYGFTKDDVVLRPEKNVVFTSDPDGPNIALYSFGHPAVTFERYYGEKEPYRGWFGQGIGGARLPANDVLLSWTEKDTTQRLTAILPARRGLSPLRSIEPLGEYGFELDGGSGKNLRCHAFRKPTRIVEGDMTATARLALFVTEGVDRKGLVLDCEQFSYKGKNYPGQNFAWTLENGTLKVERIWPNAVPEIIPASTGVTKIEHLPPVELIAPDEAYAVRYTLDGQDPTITSPLYREPIKLSRPSVLKARLFRGDFAMPASVSAEYFLLSSPPKPPLQIETSSLVPGVRFAAYIDREQWAVPVEEREPSEVGTLPDFKLSESMQTPFTNTVLTSLIKIPRAGKYTFYPDRTVRLYNSQQETPPYPEQSEVILAEGYYELEYRFSRYWKIHQPYRVPEISGPGMSRQPVPSEWLFLPPLPDKPDL
jgi:hypothetical protein